MNPLLEKYKENTNLLIIGFLKIFNSFYLKEFRRIESYVEALNNLVFWESRDFYRQTMIKFVEGKLNGLEFAQEFSIRFLILYSHKVLIILYN